MRGKLYLIPSTLGTGPVKNALPEGAIDIINTIKYFIVENVKTARRFLISAGIKTPVNDLEFFTLNINTKTEEISDYLEPITKSDIGLLSEAGVPCIADPGAEVVRIAHSRNIDVIPLVGPSSIIMALMASGLNGQNFSFVGYLPIRRSDRIKKIKQLERNSYQENQSQIFIETPYRNNQIFKDIIHSCNPDTFVCVATNITLEDERIRTMTVKDWKKQVPELNKKPTVFILKKD
jgi:16S rRNA (cytidine1402-2'-O)-methyltransferase